MKEIKICESWVIIIFNNFSVPKLPEKGQAQT